MKDDTQSSQEDVRQLDIYDALSYLDAVKMQFAERSDAYNNFLDTLKDFKCQTIDTPGVIERVSTMFRGHDDLIQGFNMFLPIGFRIDVSEASATVTTPEGNSTQSAMDLDYSASGNSAGLRAQPHPIATNHTGIASKPTSLMATTCGMPLEASFAVMTLDEMSNKDMHDGDRLDLAEGQGFHHAFQLVNQIQSRFEDDPAIFRKFLDILHSFKNSEGRNQDEVLSQVQSLFKGAPELLSEFKKYLPIVSADDVMMS